MRKRIKSKTLTGTQRQLSSGRWQAFVKHYGEVIKEPKTLLYEHEAIGWSAAAKRDVLSGIVPIESSVRNKAMSFESFYREVLVATRTWMGASLRLGTVAEHAKLYRNHLKHFAAFAVEDITIPMVDRGYKTLVDSGHLTTSPCQVQGTGQAATGVRHSHPSSEDLRALAEAGVVVSRTPEGLHEAYSDSIAEILVSNRPIVCSITPPPA